MGMRPNIVRKQQRIIPISRRIVCSNEVSVAQRIPATVMPTLAETRRNRARPHTGFLKSCEK